MTDTTLETPAVREITQGVTSIELAVAAMVIVTPAQYEDGATELARVKGAQKLVESTRTGMTAPLNQALKRINDFFRGPAQRLDAIEAVLKGKLLGYQAAQELLRQAEQRKLDEAATREREKLAAQAAKADAAGRTQRAETLAERAAMVVAPIVTREAPKVAGLATREVWRYRVVNPGAVARQFTMLDEKKIARTVAALKKDAAGVVGGIEVWPDKTLASGSQG